jgi:hypothetical protein
MLRPAPSCCIAVLPHGACDTLMCGASKNPSGSVEKEIVVFNEVLRRCAGIDVRAGCASTTQRPTCAHGVQEASSSKHRNQRIGVRRSGCACGEFVRTLNLNLWSGVCEFGPGATCMETHRKGHTDSDGNMDWAPRTINEALSTCMTTKLLGPSSCMVFAAV